jgi:hypothetical protein
MTKHTSHTEKHKGFPLLQLALGAALAAGAGYYVTHKQEVDKEAKKRIDQLAKLFKEKRPAVEKRVREVWGAVSKEAIAKYMDLRGQLLHELEEENLKKHGQMLKEHYEKIVDGVIRKARESGVLDRETEEKLGDLFKMDWTQVKQMLIALMAKGVEKTAAAVRNAKVAGKARTVRKNVKAAAKAGRKAIKKSAAKKRGKR